MGNEGYVLLETTAFDEFIEESSSFVTRYNNIREKYDSIVTELINNWQGEGAEAFKKDAERVKLNIGGIYDILKTMCDILQDSKEVFSQCDKGLGDYNREPH